MPEGLEIVDIQISPPRLTEPDIERGERQEWVEIAITVRNYSPQETYHVTSSLRTLDFNPDTQTLFLELTEPEPDLGFPQFHTFIPELAPVLPDESEVLRVSVPLIINRIISAGESLSSELEAEAIDVSGFARVNCRVSYNETPFRPVPKRGTVAQQLHTWGKITEKTLAIEK